MADRGRDLTDIITVAGEVGFVNANLQIGEANIGVGATGGYGAGLRSGTIGVYETSDLNLILVSAKYFEPNEHAISRGKGYEYTVYPHFWGGEENDFAEVEMEYGEKYNLFQIELSATLGIGLRLGINFAEMADFILGFFKIDLLEDDQKGVAARKEEILRRNELLKSIREPNPEDARAHP